MANSATLVATTKVGGKTVYSYRVVIDTTGADLTIRTPATGHKLFLVGGHFRDGTASNLSVIFGSVTHMIPEMAANQDFHMPVTRPLSFIAVGEAGEALKLNASGAAPTSGLVHVYEGKRL